MGTSARSIAGMAAVLVFFLMACIGSAKGLSPATCANRALLGAVVIYIVVSFAAKALVSIILEEIIHSKAEQHHSQDNKQ